MTDVIDAAMVLLAIDGDEICTSDPRHLTELAAAAGTHLELVPIGRVEACSVQTPRFECLDMLLLSA